jgi:hypothetical protein
VALRLLLARVLVPVLVLLVLVVVMVLVLVIKVQCQTVLNQLFDQRMSFRHHRVLSTPFGLVSIAPASLPLTVLCASHWTLFFILVSQ